MARVNILQDSPNKLHLQINPITLWIISIAFMAFGSFAAISGLVSIFAGGFVLMIIGLVFAVGGAFLFYWTRVIDCIFDKDINKMVLHEKGLLATRKREYTLESISDAQVETTVHFEPMKEWKGLISFIIELIMKTRFQSRVLILMTNGERLPLTWYKDSEQLSKYAAVNSIKKFLNIATPTSTDWSVRFGSGTSF